jgi:hypothetical protein
LPLIIGSPLDGPVDRCPAPAWGKARFPVAFVEIEVGDVPQELVKHVRTWEFRIAEDTCNVFVIREGERIDVFESGDGIELVWGIAQGSAAVAFHE